VPKQGVEGYQLVLWGAAPGGENVEARYGHPKQRRLCQEVG